MTRPVFRALPTRPVVPVLPLEHAVPSFLRARVSSEGSPSPGPGVWSREAWQAKAGQILALATGGGETRLNFEGGWTGNIRWARNQLVSSGDQSHTTLTVERVLHGAAQAMTVTNLEDEVLRATMAYIEQAIPLYRQDVVEYRVPAPFSSSAYAQPTLWYPATVALDGHARAEAAQAAITTAQQAGLVAAGYLEVTVSGVAVTRPAQQMALYYPVTEVQYSLTVRDPAGTGSGWAGVNWNDWTRVDVAQLTQTAFEKCLTSRHPVAIEPGRYTTILEPQAVYDIVRWLVDPEIFAWERALVVGVYHDEHAPTKTKIGQRLLDARLSLSADPLDPDLGFVPFDAAGEPYHPAVWFEGGVLKTLPHDRQFAHDFRLGDQGLPDSGNFRLAGEGPTASVAEMVAATARGLLVTRFSDVMMVDARWVQNSPSLLVSGYTCDGVWLLEHGQQSKAVQNFECTVSAWTVLNTIEQIGVPQRIFAPGKAIVVPPLKVRDFTFSASAD